MVIDEAMRERDAKEVGKMTYVTRWFIGVGAFVVGFFLMVWLMLGLGGLDPGHNLGISDNFVVYLFYLGGGLVSGSALALLRPRTGSSVVVLAAAVATSAMFLVASWLSGELLTGPAWYTLFGITAVVVPGGVAASDRLVERTGQGWRHGATLVLMIGLLSGVAVVTVAAIQQRSIHAAGMEEEQLIANITGDLRVTIEKCTKDEVSGTVTNSGPIAAPIVEINVFSEGSNGARLELGWGEVFDLSPGATRDWRLFAGSGAWIIGVAPDSCSAGVLAFG